MAEVEIVEARLEHVPWVAAHIRAADAEECRAAGNADVTVALEDGIRRSALAWTSFVDGNPTTIGGVVPYTLLGRQGLPWMLATEDLERVPRHVLREGRRYVEAMRAAYPILINWVDVRNTRAIRWLRSLGFRIHEPEPYGPERLPFHRFTMGVDDNV